MTEEKNMEAQKAVQQKKSFRPVLILAVIVFVIAAALYWAGNKQISSFATFKAALMPHAEKTIDGTDDQQWSYAIGYAAGQQFLEGIAQAPDPEEAKRIDRKELLHALEDVLLERDTKYTEDEIKQIFDDRAAMEQESLIGTAEENKTKSADFVAAYATEDGVEKTEGGTLYKVKESGNGPAVGSSVALVNYVGKHIDGTEFDRSDAHSEDPVPFTSDQIIPGLGEALALMHKGDKWEIVIPAETAYGENVPAGGPLEPNEALVFEIEVTDIQSAS